MDRSSTVSGKQLNKYLVNTENIYIPLDDAVIDGTPANVATVTGYYKGTAAPFSVAMQTASDATQWADKFYRTPAGNTAYSLEVQRSTNATTQAVFDNVLDMTDSLFFMALEYDHQSTQGTPSGRVFAFTKDFSTGASIQIFEYRRIEASNNAMNAYWNGGNPTDSHQTALGSGNGISIMAFDFRPGQDTAYGWQTSATNTTLLKQTLTTDLSAVTLEPISGGTNYVDTYCHIGAYHVSNPLTKANWLRGLEIRSIRFINFGLKAPPSLDNFAEDLAKNRLQGVTDATL